MIESIAIITAVVISYYLRRFAQTRRITKAMKNFKVQKSDSK
jgi:hypothetical protein